MQDARTAKTKPRVLFFGMQGDFSTPSLQALLLGDIDVCAVVVPITPLPGRVQPVIQRREQPRGKRSSLPLVGRHPSIIDIAWQQNIPVWEVSRLADDAVYETLVAYKPDMLCVACFSRRIPRSIIALPRLASLNVHPSLLPTHRGPVPLFWTLRNGEAATGVTIHYLEEMMDRGDILAQQTIPVTEGIDYEQLELQCATIGGKLLVRTIHALYRGELIGITQDESKSSYESFPLPEDFIVYAEDWEGHRIFSFVNGIRHWNELVEIHIGNEILFTKECVSYSREDRRGCENGRCVIQSDEQAIACRDGYVIVRPIR